MDPVRGAAARAKGIVRRCIFLLLLGAAGSSAEGQTVYFEVVDTDTELPKGGSTFRSWQIVQNDFGSYNILTSLQDEVALDALHRLPGGKWVLSLRDGQELGEPDPGDPFAEPPWDPRAVILWDGGLADSAYTAYPAFEGALAKIADPGVNVDAAFLDSTGAVVVSFNVPTEIDDIVYEPADLVRYDHATQSFDADPYFDASAVGIPCSVNLTAADRRGTLIVFSLEDVVLAGDEAQAPCQPLNRMVTQDVLPGQLMSWDGDNLAVFDEQPGWPDNRRSVVNALSFPAGDGPGHSGSLRLARQGEEIRLTWAASDCAGEATTAVVYQGHLRSLPEYDHAPVSCDDPPPLLEEVVPLPTEDAYFLVVPFAQVEQVEEGSYGKGKIGEELPERPVGNGACAAAQVLACR